MDLGLKGKAALVTGASRGIGRAIAIACAREGATVGIGFLQSEREAQETASKADDRGVLLRFDQAWVRGCAPCR